MNRQSTTNDYSIPTIDYRGLLTTVY